MTDPLRPFAQAIRSLWRARAEGTRGATDAGRAGLTSTTEQNASTRAPATRTGETLQFRLQSRIATVEGADRGRLRDTFVETVLLWELGDQLAPDPGFADVVARVSEQLASDPVVENRLHELLLRMAERRNPPPKD